MGRKEDFKTNLFVESRRFVDSKFLTVSGVFLTKEPHHPDLHKKRKKIWNTWQPHDEISFQWYKFFFLN